MKKAIFLDRDGTIIVDKVYLNDPNQIEYLPGAFEAMRSLRDAGYEFVVVTNQSGIPRGLVTLENLAEIHRRIRAEFSRHGVDFLHFYYAPFLTNSGHPLRKPNPGMLLEAQQEYGIDLSQSWMIGDRMVDVEAGHRAGTRSIMLAGREKPEDFDWSAPEAFVSTLLEASRFILASEPRRAGQ